MMLTIIVPLSFYCMLVHSGSTVSFAELLALYGYSFIYFIPACAICIVPNWIVNWIALLVGMLCSLSLLGRNYWQEVKVYQGLKRYLVFGLSLGGHLFFVFVCRFYLYD